MYFFPEVGGVIEERDGRAEAMNWTMSLDRSGELHGRYLGLARIARGNRVVRNDGIMLAAKRRKCRELLNEHLGESDERLGARYAVAGKRPTFESENANDRTWLSTAWAWIEGFGVIAAP